ncbi:MAG: ATP-binding protein [Bryobacteraceae bacterium]|jgi:heavy metal sensor kinase
MRTRSIQFRLTVWYALVLAAALGLFGALVWLSLRQRLIDDADRELAGSASRFEQYFRREAAEESGAQLRDELEEFCQALPGSDTLALHGSRGFEFEYPESAREQVPDHGPASRLDVRSRQTQFTVAGEEFTLEVGMSLGGIHRTIELLQILLLSLIPAVIAIASVGGAWLSRRALRPVDQLTAAARTIGIENLSQRLAVPKTGDELERLTELWNTMLGRLEAAVTTLSQFAADASHELRTPLAVIRTSAEVALRRARSPESYRESLEEIAAEAERMTQLVEDLLFLARSDAKVTGMPMSALDPRDTLCDVASELRELAEVRNIRMRLALGESEIAISGNRAALRRLFLVLLDNALKYSPPGSEVHVTAIAGDDSVTVAVRDSGSGIGAADLPHIFQRFYRANKARTDAGHGLGLSLAATIARVHGAMIEVKSVEGEGSTFLITFPLRAGGMEEPSVHPSAIRSGS